MIINGGCAMKLPNVVKWPSAAVTFLLIGGQDYFRGETTVDECLARIGSAEACVSLRCSTSKSRRGSVSDI